WIGVRGFLRQGRARDVAEQPDVEWQVGEEGDELARLGSIERADDERTLRAGRGARLASREPGVATSPGDQYRCRRLPASRRAAHAGTPRARPCPAPRRMSRRPS